MDDPELEQVTIRGSVQSGKTAALIAAGLGHMAAGRSVLIFEPDDKLKRALATRILAWGRACKDVVIREAYEAQAATLRPLYGRGRALRNHLRTRGRGGRHANGGDCHCGRAAPVPCRSTRRPRGPHGELRRQGTADHRVERRISRRVQDDDRA